MDFLLLALMVPFFSLLTGGIAAWRFYKTGNKIAFILAVLGILVGIRYGLIMTNGVFGIFGTVLNIAIALHCLIAFVLLKRPVSSLLANWLRWTLVGFMLLQVDSIISFEIKWRFGGSRLLSYSDWLLPIAAFVFSLMGWLKARHRSHPNLPPSKTYGWGIALVIIAGLFFGSLKQILKILENPEIIPFEAAIIVGNIRYSLWAWAIQVALATTVIFIATQTFLKAPADSLLAEEETNM